MDTARTALIQVLQSAYSGELAASLAYAGHWRSVRNADERDRIRSIEAEERRHRSSVGDMLRQLHGKPNAVSELLFGLLGRMLGPLCFVSGRLAPMYGAGLLESRNIVEYEVAARLAAKSGHLDLVDCLLEMAEVEWEHEFYFRAQVLKHPLARFIPMWKTPPSKTSIRATGPSRAA